MLSSIRRFLTARILPESFPTPQVLLHPAHEGDVLNQRYSIKRRLGAGFGTHSTIWLSKDSVTYTLLKTGNDVVLKITGADPMDAGKYSQLEVEFLHKVGQARRSTEQRRVIRMLDNFSLDSPFGAHSCLVLDVLGISLQELTRRTMPNKFPIPMCKRIVKEVLLGLDFFTGNDTKGVPLLGDSESPIDLSHVSLGPSSVVISDLGIASHIEDPFWGVIQPYALRAPEVYLGIPYGPSADIWNLGCLAFELVTYCRLFYPEATDRWLRDDDILGLMVSVNGLTSFPVDVLARRKFSSKYFDDSGNLLKYTVGPYSVEAMLEARFPVQPEDDRQLLADMLSRMLRLRLEDRESANELLSHPWLRDF
ncbi:kinase-like protein [Armillaria gallica]|uniref:non-specific serine/threonine protein kinase n=1 Tax=Armillaria gallica TaxID=47427 RepID=A0A2H3DCB0_ARMGA|nr:kinase-like protein [Armillaria gallica]